MHHVIHAHKLPKSSSCDTTVSFIIDSIMQTLIMGYAHGKLQALGIVLLMSTFWTQECYLS